MMSSIPFVTDALYRGDFRIHLRFDDGLAKTVDFRPMLRGPIFEPLLDPRVFRDFTIEGGTVAWPNGADIAPETLHAAPGVDAGS
jgi:hypothetical protein